MIINFLACQLNRVDIAKEIRAKTINSTKAHH